jgi:hypothetical protein
MTREGPQGPHRVHFIRFRGGGSVYAGFWGAWLQSKAGERVVLDMFVDSFGLVLRWTFGVGVA